MDGQLSGVVGVTPPAESGGQHHRNPCVRSVTWTVDGESNGDTGRIMNAVVNGARSRSTLLTGAAGLLLLMTAVVMMVCAAPRIHGVQATSAQGRLAATHGRLAPRGDQLASWVWVIRGHHIRVSPAPGRELTRVGRAPTP
jgi:hypothetical protein